jgi:hypothetical protein
MLSQHDDIGILRVLLQLLPLLVYVVVTAYY